MLSIMDPSRSEGGPLPVVLYVDDEEPLRLQTERLLRGRFEVLHAGSAAEASELMERHRGPIDVLLMDINLPDGWGSVLAQQLLAVRPNLPVVYTTGYAEHDPVLAGGLRDAAFVLTKPFKGRELLDILERAMNMKTTEPTDPEG
jgi:hypothetical protein